MIWNLIRKAKELFFDNSESGLEATDVQGAIDEVNNKLVWKTHLDITPEKNAEYTLPNEWNELHIYLGRNNGHSYTWQVVGNYNNFEKIYLPRVGATNSETVILIKNNTILVSILTEGGTDILGNASNFGLRLIIKYR